jgi:hypothetical protein
MITYTIFRGEDVSPEEMGFVLSMLTSQNIDRPADAITFVFSAVFSKKNDMGTRIIIVHDDEQDHTITIDLDQVDAVSQGKGLH